ncbi:hypothetical protein GWK47_048940 [Chionoecetes opilio]|uniref:Uncharacterized protein n=1 Tax=Chionoecetes opilio TaxID=41210 RepID=A0A8J4YCA5_CHIOP|nr:hypothetical protein GWK47_048940 [Chionoecetes opilio]
MPPSSSQMPPVGASWRTNKLHLPPVFASLCQKLLMYLMLVHPLHPPSPWALPSGVSDRKRFLYNTRMLNWSLGTSDISLSDVELDSSQLFTQDIEESGTEQEDQRKRQEGTRQLKAMLWHLEKCTVPCFSASGRPLMGRARGAAPRPGRTSSPPRGVAASSAWRVLQPEGHSDPQRWFIDTMMPLSLIDHPPTRHFFSLLAPEFSAPSRRTLGRGKRPGLRHRQVGPLQYAFMTPATSPQRPTAGRRTTGPSLA